MSTNLKLYQAQISKISLRSLLSYLAGPLMKIVIR